MACYQQWFAEVLQRTAKLVAQWQGVGFVHAVMNTDNMSILGQTIDYGPYGWLEEYDPAWTPNFVDQQGRRYSYGNQPQIALWNLYRLANAILPLFDDNPGPLEEVLGTYNEHYDAAWNNIRKNKTGLSCVNADTDNTGLINRLWELLENSGPDYTVFFSTLTDLPMENDAESLADQLCNTAYYEPVTDETRAALQQWLEDWRRQVTTADPQSVKQTMRAANPKFVLRNHIAIEAIDAAERGDFTTLHRVAAMIKKPYENQPEFESYAGLRPDWAKTRPGCTMLTCSS